MGGRVQMMGLRCRRPARLEDLRKFARGEMSTRVDMSGHTRRTPKACNGYQTCATLAFDSMRGWHA